ncbi:Firmicu-CTERM sorting domain-containing protein [Butyrivibrio sp. VCB2001]|uniref:Firmicu-CTERM sorting domain-containing protein n=1 Tax=Butyrivibrio sp. VCB2001 TaxID=1280667 RepID=UPI000428B2CD|nr:Firmicu-CTERM sorting domain-containing protein [Butyrivibrio sp. VCB2001]
MRNKFYRIVAIFIAMNMMSATVFAAEDAALTQETPAEQPAATDQGSTGTDQQSGDQTSADQGNAGTDQGSADQGNAGNDQGSSDQGAPSSGSEGEGTTPSASGDSQSGSEPQQQNTEGTNPDSTNTENTEEETRRTAQKQQEGQTQDTSSSSSSESESSGSSGSGESGMWSNAAEITDVMGLKVSNQGDSVVISYKTKHSNPWEYTYKGNPITITYPDGTTRTITFDWDGNGIHGDGWTNIDGATVTKSSDQNDTEIATITIPASYFNSMDFTLSSGEYKAEIDGTPIAQDNSAAVYTGINMDGTFNDWNAVQKSTLNEPNGDHCVEEVAWVIENDYVYIYLKDDGSNSATWAGPNHNGKYAITTDLGRTLVFQLTEDGAVVGAKGASATHVGSQWEIAIPTSSLPNNNGGLSFGLYLSDTTLDGYGDTLSHESTTDIKYDGLYGDWDNYPHKEIQYANAGTHENVPDGEAAIYVDNNVYGHCETRMQSHLDEKGGEYTQGVSIIVNNDWSHALQMRLATVDSAGNINWNPAKQNLENGSYEYYIFDVGCWGSSTNINNLFEADVCYGKATVTLTEGRHDMEWYVDSNKLAARYGILETDMKTVSSQYGRIGPEVVTSAGTSTGPWAGAGMCVLTALVPFVIKKKFVF